MWYNVVGFLIQQLQHVTIGHTRSSRIKNACEKKRKLILPVLTKRTYNLPYFLSDFEEISND